MSREGKNEEVSLKGIREKSRRKNKYKGSVERTCLACTEGIGFGVVVKWSDG